MSTWRACACERALAVMAKTRKHHPELGNWREKKCSVLLSGLRPPRFLLLFPLRCTCDRVASRKFVQLGFLLFFAPHLRRPRSCMGPRPRQRWTRGGPTFDTQLVRCMPPGRGSSAQRIKLQGTQLHPNFSQAVSFWPVSRPHQSHVHWGHDAKTLFVVYLKFKLSRGSCIFSGHSVSRVSFRVGVVGAALFNGRESYLAAFSFPFCGEHSP